MLEDFIFFPLVAGSDGGFIGRHGRPTLWLTLTM